MKNKVQKDRNEMDDWHVLYRLFQAAAEQPNPTIALRRAVEDIIDGGVDFRAAEHTPEDKVGNPRSKAAKKLGRYGGLKGGRARARALTPERRSEIARNAANVRWRMKKPDGVTPNQE